MAYKNMNTIPIGTKMKIKKTGELVTLIQIFHYPTTFKVEYDDGRFDSFRTHAIEFIDE
tara:strand:+ start:628 stop:804 length:177 start_codon:yes stop_codon:yes gene_type:complete